MNEYMYEFLTLQSNLGFPHISNVVRTFAMITQYMISGAICVIVNFLTKTHTSFHPNLSSLNYVSQIMTIYLKASLSLYRWYPAKRALPAMLTHGR